MVSRMRCARELLELPLVVYQFLDCSACLGFDESEIWCISFQKPLADYKHDKRSA